VSLKPLSALPLTLANTFTRQTLFSTIAEQPWAMWLDSSESDHVDSRYDIMVWQPAITLVTTGDNTRITNNISAQYYDSSEDPLLLIKNEQQALFADTELSNLPLPFKGGAVGYFAYDLGKRFESLPNTNQQDIALPEMAVGIYQHAVIFDKYDQQFWLLCFDDKREELQHYFNQALATNNTITAAPFALSTDWQANMTQVEYQQKFAQVQQYLLSGDCYQINLAQRFTASYQGDEFNAYCALRAENKAPFSAFLRFQDSTILSISPERFLQLNDTKVQSKPIKGTRPRSENNAEDIANAKDLQHATKDRAENLMIVDLLRNDISKVCKAGTVSVPSLFAIESFPAVHHLVSTVEGEIAPEYDGTDLLRASFPGGSITGAPKIRAMSIIDELEPHQRSVYCGSIGYLSACGAMDSSITIRTLICTDNKIHCWAGGGLVADSQVDCEYQETYDKVKKILPILKSLTPEF
jgi:para-aminobenzoate synthetase component 1